MICPLLLCVLVRLILLDVFWWANTELAYFPGEQHLSRHSLQPESASNAAPDQPLTTNITLIICFLWFSGKWRNNPPLKRWCISLASSSLLLSISADLWSSVALWPRNLPHPYRPSGRCCLRTENQATRVKRQFPSSPENQSGSKAQEALICRAGGRGLQPIWRGSWSARTAARNICPVLGCTVRLVPLWRDAADGCRWKRPGPVWTEATEVTCERMMHGNPAGLALS